MHIAISNLWQTTFVERNGYKVFLFNICNFTFSRLLYWLCNFTFITLVQNNYSQQVRNCRPSFHSSLGMYGGLAYSAFSTLVRGKEPWTLSHGGNIYKIIEYIQRINRIS